jgi:hypothetical protein
MKRHFWTAGANRPAAPAWPQIKFLANEHRPNTISNEPISMNQIFDEPILMKQILDEPILMNRI